VGVGETTATEAVRKKAVVGAELAAVSPMSARGRFLPGCWRTVRLLSAPLKLSTLVLSACLITRIDPADIFIGRIPLDGFSATLIMLIVAQTVLMLDLLR
jgi:hypothetical protein